MSKTKLRKLLGIQKRSSLNSTISVYALSLDNKRYGFYGDVITLGKDAVATPKGYAPQQQ